jgi:hypothetical protein
VLSHDGGSRGYESFLRVLPDQTTAVVLLVNGGGDASALVAEVFGPSLRELCGVAVPPPWTPPGVTGPGEDAPAPVTGTYACGTWRLAITGRGGELHGELGARGMAARELGRAPVSLRLRPAGPGCFAVSGADPGECWPLHVVRLPDGTRLVHMWSRAAPAVQE